MRKLQTRDTFALARLIKEVDLKTELTAFASSGKVYKNDLDFGMDLLFTLINKFTDKEAEHLFYEFLTGPFELTADEVGSMDLFDLVTGLKEIADWEKWQSFLKLAIPSM